MPLKRTTVFEEVLARTKNSVGVGWGGVEVRGGGGGGVKGAVPNGAAVTTGIILHQRWAVTSLYFLAVPLIRAIRVTGQVSIKSVIAIQDTGASGNTNTYINTCVFALRPKTFSAGVLASRMQPRGVTSGSWGHLRAVTVSCALQGICCTR